MIRRLSFVLVGAALVLLVLHLAGVATLRYFVERELHPALPKGTQIREIHVDPVRGAIEIRGFYLRNEGVSRIRVGRLVADVNASRLFTGQVEVERIALSDAYVLVERRPDGRFDLGLPEFGGADSEPSEGPPPDVVLDEFTIDGLTIDYRDGDLTSQAVVNKLVVGKYSLQSQSQVLPISWDLLWDGQKIEGAVEVVIEADRLEASGTLSTDPLDLERAQRLARLDPQVVGRLGFRGEMGWDGRSAKVDGTLVAPDLKYQLAARTITIDRAESPRFSLALQLEPMLSATLDLTQGVKADEWSWSGDGQRVTGREVVQLGRVTFAEGENATAEDFRLTAAHLSWQDGPRSAEVNDLDAKGRVSQPLRGEGVLPGMDLTAKSGAVRFADESAELSVEVASLDVDRLAMTAPDEGSTRGLVGMLSLGRSRVQLADQSLDIENVSLKTGGRVSTHSQQIDGDLGARGIRVQTPILSHGPLTFTAIEAGGFRLGETNGVAELTVREMALPGGREETGLQVAKINVQQASYDATAGVDIGEVEIDGLQTGVIRDQAGVWQHVMTPPEADRGGTEQGTTEPQTTAGSALPWRVGGLRMTGDNSVTVADALNPDMQPIRYRIASVTVGTLDSQRPGADTPFSLTLQPDRYSEFEIAGKVRPLDDPLFLEAEGHVQGFGLNSVNGLVANDLGHRFLTGQIDDDFTIKIENNRLEMGNQLNLSSLDVEPLPDKEGPPLGTAIALLEDRDGNIKLEVPVSGDLSDPDFRVLAALNPIIMKAVAGAAALAIQPMGSVLLVGTLLADQALKVTFEPALFDPGTTTLNADARGYLQELAAKLKEKPKLGVRLCGVYAASEREKDKKGEYTEDSEELIGRAQQRADAVRDFMKQQGVGDNQLRRCRPSLDPTDTGKPRVDIRF